jgi:hypothetical protein
MKALENDRDRRYQTANGLAMDVQRCLNNEPIVARPPSRLYQFGKMARRNRALFSAVTAVALTLVAALGASMWLLRQEIRARDRAVAAEKVEAQLRREAEARAKVAQALILINGERMSDADNLVDGLEWTAPSTDASSVLRALGDWRALSGQWKRAAPRLEALTFVNESEGWDLASLDFLECGACLAEMGDVAGYERFHRICADRFNGTTNLVLAERMLKINLLLPTAPPDSRALRTWAETAAQPVTGTENVEFRAAWRCVSLALYEYRMGHPTEAVARCKECLASPEFNAPRVATAEVIMALALHRLGSDEEARAHLQVGRQMIEAKFAAELGPGSATQGFWFDWIFGRVLLREALPQIL